MEPLLRIDGVGRPPSMADAADFASVYRAEPDRYSVIAKAPMPLRKDAAPAGTIVLPSSLATNAAKIPLPVFGPAPEAHPLMDAIESHVAGVVGYLELLGMRFHVHAYKASLPAVAADGRVARDNGGSIVASGLMRGSRVDADDIRWLKSQGFEGVLSLLAEGDGREQQLVRAAGMDAERIRIIDNHPPSLGDVKRALDFMCAHKPVYVHCEAGIGRTGTIIAAYRIAVEGCTVQQALAEAAKYGPLIPWQREFLRDLPGHLAHGDIPGYRLHGNAAREYAVQQAAHPPRHLWLLHDGR